MTRGRVDRHRVRPAFKGAERQPSGQRQAPIPVSRALRMDYIQGTSCPVCGVTMFKQINRQTGELFLSCPKFPDCSGTRPYRG